MSKHVLNIVKTGDENPVEIHGEITFSTITQLFSDSKELFHSQTESIRIDFSSVTHVDSASLVLLIEWKRLAKKQGKSVRFINLPESVKRLAELSQILNLLTESEGADE